MMCIVVWLGMKDQQGRHGCIELKLGDQIRENEIKYRNEQFN